MTIAFDKPGEGPHLPLPGGRTAPHVCDAVGGPAPSSSGAAPANDEEGSFRTWLTP